MAWCSGRGYGNREVYPIQSDGTLGPLARGNVVYLDLVLPRTFTPSLECLQRSHYLEELKPSEYTASPWRRHIHLAVLHHLGVDGIWNSKRVSRVFPRRTEV